MLGNSKRKVLVSVKGEKEGRRGWEKHIKERQFKRFKLQQQIQRHVLFSISVYFLHRSIKILYDSSRVLTLAMVVTLMRAEEKLDGGTALI